MPALRWPQDGEPRANAARAPPPSPSPPPPPPPPPFANLLLVNEGEIGEELDKVEEASGRDLGLGTRGTVLLDADADALPL